MARKTCTAPVINEVPDFIGTVSNAYDLAAAVTLMEIEKRYVVLTASAQRRLFGSVPFGKCRVYFDAEGQGKVSVARTVCFGTMDEVSKMEFSELFSQIAAGHTCRAGFSGPLQR